MFHCIPASRAGVVAGVVEEGLGKLRSTQMEVMVGEVTPPNKRNITGNS